MIPSARAIVMSVANIVFCCFVFLDLKSGDGWTDRWTYGRTTGAKTMIPTFELAKWIKELLLVALENWKFGFSLVLAAATSVCCAQGLNCELELYKCKERLLLHSSSAMTQIAFKKECCKNRIKCTITENEFATIECRSENASNDSTVEKVKKFGHDFYFSLQLIIRTSMFHV